jgi:hypothetical protein
LDLDVREEEVADLIPRPGEFSAYHSHLVHGGLPNQANFNRIGLVPRYISADTRQPQGNDAAMLMRGCDRHGF